ncbi:hypothetical protein Tco_0161533 [Tanacetum coccineum]
MYVKCIIGDEMGDGSSDGDREIGSEPDVHSGKGGVCTGGAGGLSDSGANPEPFPTSNVLYTSPSSNANSRCLNAPYPSPKDALTVVPITGAACY